MTENQALHIESLYVSMNGQTILKGIDLCLRTREFCALVGHNGAGKSLTIKTILGLQKRNRGQIFIHGINIDDDFEKYKRQYTYIPEEPLLFTELTVRQHFQLCGTSYQVPKDVFEKRVSHYVTAFELQDKMDEYPQNLSKGMRQKVSIISSFIVDTPLMVIDEPFYGLDVNAANLLEEELKKKKKEGVSVLVTTHAIERLKSFCDRYVMLKNGEVVQKGDIEHLQQIERREIHE